MEQLVRRAINGDTDAFLELMDQNTQIMYKTAWSVLRNNEDASDAVAETILTCFEKIYTLKNPAFPVLTGCCFSFKMSIVRLQNHYEEPGSRRARDF